MSVPLSAVKVGVALPAGGSFSALPTAIQGMGGGNFRVSELECCKFVCFPNHFATVLLFPVVLDLISFNPFHFKTPFSFPLVSSQCEGF